MNTNFFFNYKENEELITDVQPSFSLERGEEDATIEIELESYEKEKYSWFLKYYLIFIHIYISE